jgi:hypothetical protein
LGSSLVYTRQALFARLEPENGIPLP